MDGCDEFDPDDAIGDATEGGRTVSVEIGEDETDQRADQALASLLAGLSRSQVQRLIKDGQVRVGGAISTPSFSPVAHESRRVSGKTPRVASRRPPTRASSSTK